MAATSEAQCRDACLGRSDCVAFDFNPSSGGQCKIHTDRSKAAELYNAPGVLHEVRISCTDPASVCDYVYKTIEGMNTRGATGVPGQTDSDCRQACSKRPDCLAYDFDPKAKSDRCWLNTDPHTAYDLYPAPGISHNLKGGCPGLPLGNYVRDSIKLAPKKEG